MNNPGTAIPKSILRTKVPVLGTNTTGSFSCLKYCTDPIQPDHVVIVPGTLNKNKHGGFFYAEPKDFKVVHYKALPWTEASHLDVIPRDKQKTE